MKTTETRAVLHIALMAGFADGAKHEREREAVRSIAESLGNDQAVNLPSLYQDVLLKRVSLASAAAALESDEIRQLAYEMAVCLCDADGVHSSAEQAFLQDLQQQLGLAQAPSEYFVQQADSLAAAAVPVAANPASASSTPPPPPPLTVIDRDQLEAQIRTAAITNGALELLPETLSTMAIIPLQMRLVYRIGKAHGYKLDSGHIKDFLATLGVGLTSQYLESAGRKLLGGMLKKAGGSMLGGVLGGLGKQAISSGMSFASTYALGHVALAYYAGGRKLSTDVLKNTYQRLFGQGQQLQLQMRPQIEQRAQTLDMGEIMQLVRGKGA
ncbi:GTPase [Lysobacteraceae bacterium NML95-0200]|nr:GTPase [Xanthomonadaceae bacterium NML95-0200]